MCSFFIKAVTATTGIEHIYVTPQPTSPITGVIYVKEKTVFYAATNTAVKVIYLSSTKILAKSEKIITTLTKANIQPLKKATSFMKSSITFKEMPYYKNIWMYTGKSLGRAITIAQQQYLKISTAVKKQTNQTPLLLQRFFKDCKSCVYTNNDVNIHHKIPGLSGYYSLPPPC